MVQAELTMPLHYLLTDCDHKSKPIKAQHRPRLPSSSSSPKSPSRRRLKTRSELRKLLMNFMPYEVGVRHAAQDTPLGPLPGCGSCASFHHLAGGHSRNQFQDNKHQGDPNERRDQDSRTVWDRGVTATCTGRCIRSRRRRAEKRRRTRTPRLKLHPLRRCSLRGTGRRKSEGSGGDGDNNYYSQD